MCLPAQITELAGYTARVHNMFVVFEDVQKGVYKRSSLSDAAGTEKKTRPEMHIDGPLEIKGTLSCVCTNRTTLSFFLVVLENILVMKGPIHSGLNPVYIKSFSSDPYVIPFSILYNTFLKELT